MTLMNDSSLTNWMLAKSGGLEVIDSAGNTCSGHLDTIDASAFQGARVKVATHTLVIPTGMLEEVTIGAAITVASAAYTVNDRMRNADGTTTLLLRRGT